MNRTVCEFVIVYIVYTLLSTLADLILASNEAKLHRQHVWLNVKFKFYDA